MRLSQHEGPLEMHKIHMLHNFEIPAALSIESSNQNWKANKTYLIEAIGVCETRTVEKTGQRDDGQVQHIVSDSNTRSGLGTGFALEHAERQVLNREVRVRVDFDEWVQHHRQPVTDETMSSGAGRRLEMRESERGEWKVVVCRNWSEGLIVGYVIYEVVPLEKEGDLMVWSL